MGAMAPSSAITLNSQRVYSRIKGKHYLTFIGFNTGHSPSQLW
jgi:hypothetical protein